MKDLRIYSDHELLEKVNCREDHKAFEELYNRHFTPVFRYVYKILQERATAEDLVQNIFMDLWKKDPSRNILSLKAYLFGAARNQIAKEIRRNKWNREQLAFVENISGSLSTDEYISELETRSKIEDAVHKLPGKCQNVFKLSRYKYLSNKEIAQKLGISVYTVENHIKKALYQIRQSLELFLFLLLIK